MTKRRAWLPLLGAVAAALTAGGCGGSHAIPARAAASRILFLSDRTGAWALYSMNVSGGDQQRVLNNVGGVEPGGEGIGLGVPSLSPDGRQVLLPRNGITAVTLATGKSRRIPLGDGSSALWSPDSKSVVYADNRREYTSTGVYVTDLKSGKTRRIARGDFHAPVSWSPDGKWILIARYTDNPDSLWLVHPDGTGYRQLTTYMPTGDVLWLPHGRIEYVGSPHREIQPPSRLVVVDLRSGKVTSLGKLPTPDAVTWSPDGRRFAFDAGSEDSKPAAVYTMDASGGNRHRVTPSGTGFYGQLPAWSADGKTLLLARYGQSAIAKHAAEIWSMHADGSNARQLTRAYPDGGENVDPLWFNGQVHAVTPRVAVESPRGKGFVLRVPYLVDGVGAAGTRAAVLPHSSDSYGQPTSPLLVWHPGSSPVSLVGSLCGSLLQPVFVGSRLAVDCAHDFSDEHAQSLFVFDLQTRIPTSAIFAYSENFGVEFGTTLYGPVLGGGQVVFESEDWTPLSKNINGSRLIRRTLWRVDGSSRRRVRSIRRLGELLAAAPTRLVFRLSDRHFAITNTAGKRLTVLSLPPPHLPRFDAPPVTYLLTTHEFLRLAGASLGAWNIATGRLDWSQHVPPGASLQSAGDGLVVYSAKSALYLRSNAGVRVIKTDATRKRRVFRYGLAAVTAAVTPAGLFYAYDVAGSPDPGVVVFVPRSDLPH